jgi:hypothetical protein
MRSAEPSEAACKFLMRVARRTIRDNSVFISRETGEVVSTAWRDKNSWFPRESLPQGTYEIHIDTGNPFFSYEDLQYWIDPVMQRIWEEDEMEEQQAKDLEELASYSEDILKYQFGFSDRKIAELRESTVGA